jgi:hypothetical protein
MVAPPQSAMEPDQVPEVVGRGRAHPEIERAGQLEGAAPSGRGVALPAVASEPGATTRKRPSPVPDGRRGAHLAVRPELVAPLEPAARWIEAIVRGPERGNRRAQTVQRARTVQTGLPAPIVAHAQSGRRGATPPAALRHRLVDGHRRRAPARRAGGARGNRRVQPVGRPLRVAALLAARQRGVPLRGTPNHAPTRHAPTGPAATRHAPTGPAATGPAAVAQGATGHGAARQEPGAARPRAPEPGPGRRFRAPMTTNRCPGRRKSGGTLRAAVPAR